MNMTCVADVLHDVNAAVPQSNSRFYSLLRRKSARFLRNSREKTRAFCGIFRESELQDAIHRFVRLRVHRCKNIIRSILITIQWILLTTMDNHILLSFLSIESFSFLLPHFVANFNFLSPDFEPSNVDFEESIDLFSPKRSFCFTGNKFFKKK